MRAEARREGREGDEVSDDRIAAIVRRMRAHLDDLADAIMSPERSARDAMLIGSSARVIRKWTDELEAIANEGDR